MDAALAHAAGSRSSSSTWRSAAMLTNHPKLPSPSQVGVSFGLQRRSGQVFPMASSIALTRLQSSRSRQKGIVSPSVAIPSAVVSAWEASMLPAMACWHRRCKAAADEAAVLRSLSVQRSYAVLRSLSGEPAGTLSLRRSSIGGLGSEGCKPESAVHRSSTLHGRGYSGGDPRATTNLLEARRRRGGMLCARSRINSSSSSSSDNADETVTLFSSQELEKVSVKGEWRGLGGDLIDDIRRKLPFYFSDFADGVHLKAVAATIFLFFACLTPCIAFGSLTAMQTGGSIGLVETLVGTAVSGLIYALFAGQPLTLLGPTGLVVVFTSLLFKACATLSLPFLPVYSCVGLWSALFLLVLSLTGASNVIHIFTRFTDETFSALISLGFIAEAIKYIKRQFLLPAASTAPALLSLIVAVGTWQLTDALTELRKTPLLSSPLRQFLSDFAAPLTIALMSLLPPLLLPSTPLPTLFPSSPSSSPSPLSLLPSISAALSTTSGRPWLVSLASLPASAVALSAVPAALLTLLMFLDQNITTRLVDSREAGLVKGSGYHLDIAVLGGIMAVTSLFGLPWMVASTVPSLAHVRILSSSESPQGSSSVEPTSSAMEAESSATTPSAARVRENRVTGIAIHLLIAASVLLLPLLSFVPTAVTQGLFLFMGVSSLRGNQFIDRLKLWAFDPSLYPKFPFINGVPLPSLHLFTAIQLACLASLWTVKLSKWGIFFPLLIVALLPVRNEVIGRLIPQDSLQVLDSH